MSPNARVPECRSALLLTGGCDQCLGPAATSAWTGRCPSGQSGRRFGCRLQILVDDKGLPSGVIDWGDVHLGNPGVDLAVVFGFLPLSARDTFWQTYGKVDDGIETMARFRALYHAVMVVLYGDDIGDAALTREGFTAMRFVLEG